MLQLYYDLEKILQQEYELAAGLLKETKKQNFALRKNDLDTLNEAVSEIEEFVSKLRELDHYRSEITTRLEDELGLEPGTKLSDIAATAPENLPFRLQYLRREIGRCLDEVHQLVDLNNLLSRNALRFNNLIIGLFRQPGGATYSNSGSIREGSAFHSTVNKSV